MKGFLLSIITFLSAFLISACVGGSSNVSMVRYTLTDDIGSEALSSLNDVRVKLYGAINENAVVIQLSPVEIRPASSHLWNGKLSDQLALIMSDLMLKEGLAHDLHADIFVTKFYGSLSGEVTIDAFFKVSRGNKILVAQNFNFHDRQLEPGYSALVMLLKKGWTSICLQALQMAKE